MELAKRYNVAVSVEGNAGVFVNQVTARVEEMSRMIAQPLPQIRDLTQIFIPGETSQLCLFADNQTEIEIISQLPLLSSSRWCDVFADINVAGVDKGTGLYEMVNFYGFSVISPSTCFQGIDTLRIASKHAEGMSLRFDAICTILILVDRFGCYP